MRGFSSRYGLDLQQHRSHAPHSSRKPALPSIHIDTASAKRLSMIQYVYRIARSLQYVVEVRGTAHHRVLDTGCIFENHITGLSVRSMTGNDGCVCDAMSAQIVCLAVTIIWVHLISGLVTVSKLQATTELVVCPSPRFWQFSKPFHPIYSLVP